jgi:hypothetical protein
MSISARRGSPSADWTVIRPKARALASEAEKPNSTAVATARAVVRHSGFSVDVEALIAWSAGNFFLFMRTNASTLNL